MPIARIGGRVVLQIPPGLCSEYLIEGIGNPDYPFQSAQKFYIAVTQLKQIDRFAQVASGDPPLKNNIKLG